MVVDKNEITYWRNSPSKVCRTYVNHAEEELIQYDNDRLVIMHYPLGIGVARISHDIQCMAFTSGVSNDPRQVKLLWSSSGILMRAMGTLDGKRHGVSFLNPSAIGGEGTPYHVYYYKGSRISCSKDDGEEEFWRTVKNGSAPNLQVFTVNGLF